MSASLPNRAGDRQPVLAETRPRMAQATLRKAETRVGRAIARAMSLCGWSLKEFAAAVGRDERQCSRWIREEEHPQLDVLFAVEGFRHPLIQALAELAGAEVEITVRLKQRVG